MNKITQDLIMEHKYHEFLYGEKTKERTEFLKEMVTRYPISYGKDEPMGIYLENYGIKKNEVDYSQFDKDTNLLLNILARDYLKLLIIKNIISKIEDDSDIMGKIEEEFLKYLVEKCDSKKNIKSVKEYLQLVQEAIEIYNISHNSLLCGGNCHPFIGTVPNFCFDLSRYLESIKKILNNKEQFNIIIDYQTPLTLESVKAINSIINMRCTGSLCMKVAIHPDEWPTYYEFNDRIIQQPHDYTYVELDDSMSKSLEKKRRLCLNEEDD